ncbi:MAG: site-2 protease family protein [Candidatus Helarchaeota archaeon]|nr:site-2 protease family protein [Candidatus Helarchaeota archaeon]
MGATSAPHARPATHQMPPPEPESAPSQSQQASTEEWQPTPGAEVERYFEPDGTEVIVERIPIYAIQRPEKPVFKYFSALELKHLAIGLAMMFGVGISMFITVSFFSGGGYYEWWVYLTLAGFATLAFILHEFGHKFTGIKLGNWSEFRLIKIFAILTAISVIPFNPVKIVCPGAVQVTGDTKPANMGKIALAGPLVNLIQAVLFIILAPLLGTTTDLVFKILIIAAYLNSFLGLFNLIPLGPLDGLKVVRWNKPLYFISLILLIAVLIYVFPLVSL